ncbi:hypothetical protein K438DRAFT_1910993 [Mycena galopus ATCC 62051]|nr:hypothetical protein K438DRAFT_1910993 [Mycena galopus ATCC 62051]
MVEDEKNGRRIDGRCNELRVVLFKNCSEIRSYILSGAVMEPSALDALLPQWRETYPDHPLSQPVTSSGRLLTEMSNKGNYIASLSRVAAWLGGIAEELVYPGFASAQFFLSPSPAGDAQGRQVRSAVTHDAALSRQCTKGPRFQPGVAFRAWATLLTEGVHGSLSKQAAVVYDLRHGKEAQTYRIGIKEVWRVEDGKHVPGKVLRTLGWPLSAHTYGGGWEYHLADGLVSIGLVPYRDFQRTKYHPQFRALLANGTRLAYGARALTKGGLQSLPRLDFPGGPLVGCIKGTHNAMRLWGNFQTKKVDAPLSLAPYTAAFPRSPVHTDLWAVRNMRPGCNTHWGQWGGELYAEFDTMLGRRVPWTLRHHKERSPLSLPSILPDNLKKQHTNFIQFYFLLTDLMSSVALTGTNHAEGEAVHLRVIRADEDAPPDTDPHENPARRRAHVHANVGTYAGLLQRARPAGVYEYVADDGGRAVLNCIHCKLDIKVQTQDIT